MDRQSSPRFRPVFRSPIEFHRKLSLGKTQSLKLQAPPHYPNAHLCPRFPHVLPAARWPLPLHCLGSPLIDAGNNSLTPMGVTFDRRGAGFPRVVGDRVDNGAVEAAAVVAASQPTLVPAGSTWTLSLLGLLLGTFGFFGLRGRQQSP